MIGFFSVDRVCCNDLVDCVNCSIKTLSVECFFVEFV